MSFWNAHLGVLQAARDLVDCKHERTQVFLLHPRGTLRSVSWCRDCGASLRDGGAEWERASRAERLAQAVLEQAESFRAGGKAAIEAIGGLWKGLKTPRKPGS